MIESQWTLGEDLEIEAKDDAGNWEKTVFKEKVLFDRRSSILQKECGEGLPFNFLQLDSRGKVLSSPLHFERVGGRVGCMVSESFFMISSLKG